MLTAKSQFVIGHFQELCVHVPDALALGVEQELVVAAISTDCWDRRRQSHSQALPQVKGSRPLSRAMTVLDTGLSPAAATGQWLRVSSWENLGNRTPQQEEGLRALGLPQEGPLTNDRIRLCSKGTNAWGA